MLTFDRHAHRDMRVAEKKKTMKIRTIDKFIFDGILEKYIGNNVDATLFARDGEALSLYPDGTIERWFYTDEQLGYHKDEYYYQYSYKIAPSGEITYEEDDGYFLTRKVTHTDGTKEETCNKR